MTPKKRGGDSAADGADLRPTGKPHHINANWRFCGDRRHFVRRSNGVDTLAAEPTVSVRQLGGAIGWSFDDARRSTLHGAAHAGGPVVQPKGLTLIALLTAIGLGGSWPFWN
jgi:hypothetical protein